LLGIGEIFKTILSIIKYCNKSNLQIAGILITRYKGNTNTSREIFRMIEDTAKKLNTKVFKSRIREAVAVREAEAARIDLYSHAPKSTTTLDYIEFAKELMGDLNAKKES